jgi:LCP family protein required for cell wall assembly
MAAQSRKPSRIKRFFGFIAFRLIPVILVIAIVWSGYQVAKAVVEKVSTAVELDQRSDDYAGTAVAVAPTLATHTPTDTPVPSSTPIPDTATPTFTPTSTDTATSTFTPTATVTDTPVPTATLTNTPLPTATDTLTPLPTLTFTSSPTLTPQVVAQFFATNTPNAGIGPLVTNTPDVPPTAVFTSTPLPTTTPLPTATETLIPTPTFTDTPPPQPTATETPLPLPTVFFPVDPSVQQAGGTAVPTRVPLVDRQGYDLVNVLLLGGDDEVTGDNFLRTDTMIVVSINRTTNTVAMLSFPRDIYVYTPNGGMNRLNVAYQIGESIGWTDGGFGFLRQTILYNFGINVHYYALVNFSGFEQIIDGLGGVEVAVDCAYEDYYPVADLDPTRPVEENYELRTLPVGYYTFDGFDALWYARTRRVSDDFDRGRRQQQILRAIWRKGRSQVTLTNFPQLWGQLTQVVKTDLGLDDMLGLVPIGLNLDVSRIENFTFKRYYHTTPWTTPNGENVQLPNPAAVQELMQDFYQPPTENQILSAGASIAVYNGTSNADWDRVAAERLAWEGFNGISAGVADRTDYADTIIIDHVGQEKGSSLNEIAAVLNITADHITVDPDPNRTADYEVILGANYNSCADYNVLPVG